MNVALSNKGTKDSRLFFSGYWVYLYIIEAGKLSIDYLLIVNGRIMELMTRVPRVFSQSAGEAGRPVPWLGEARLTNYLASHISRVVGDHGKMHESPPSIYYLKGVFSQVKISISFDNNKCTFFKLL